MLVTHFYCFSLHFSCDLTFLDIEAKLNLNRNEGEAMGTKEKPEGCQIKEITRKSKNRKESTTETNDLHMMSPYTDKVGTS